MPEKLITRLTWAVLPFITFMLSGGPAYAALAADARADEARREQARQALPRDFDDVVGELGAALSQVAAGDGDAVDDVQALFAEIRERDAALRQEFAEVEKMIREKGLPDEVLERHRAFVAKYEERLAAVRKGVADVEHGTPLPDGFFERAWVRTKTYFGGDPVREQAAADTRELIELGKTNQSATTGKPSQVPFRRLSPVDVPSESKLDSQEFWHSQAMHTSDDGDSDSVGQFVGPFLSLLVNSANAQESPPEPMLEETLEVRFTPEIRNLSEQLDGSPALIYRWVYNNIEFSPVWGSTQGANGCLRTRVCSAFDTASLLIALLRVSGVPAEYVFGNASLPADKFSKWLGGFDTADLAASFLAGAGTPDVVRQVDESNNTIAVRFGHVWVRAYVDYLPGAGVFSAAGDSWLDLDASFKLVESFGRGDFSQFSSVTSGQALIDLLLEPSSQNGSGGIKNIGIEAAILEIEPDLPSAIDYIAGQFPGLSISEVLMGQRTHLSSQPILPSTLPFIVLAGSTTHTSIPENLRHSISIEVRSLSGDRLVSYQSPLASVNDGLITLAFEPATALDRQFFDELFSSGSGGLFPDSISAWAARVAPRILVEGVEQGSGGGLRLGEGIEIRVEILGPSIKLPAFVNLAKAGETYVFGINKQRISQSVLQKISSRLDAFASSLESAVVTGDVSELDLQSAQIASLGALTLGWMSQVDAVSEIVAGANRVRWARYPSYASAFSRLQVAESVFGLPAFVSFGDFAFDIDADIVVSAALDGDLRSQVHHGIVTGYAGSALESAVPKMFFGPELEEGYWVSTASYQDSASQQDVFKYVLSSGASVSATELTGLDPVAAVDIDSEVAKGRLVSVYDTSLEDVQANSFSAYTSIDPQTGSGDFIIEQLSGGLAAECFPRRDLGDAKAAEKFNRAMWAAGIDKGLAYAKQELISQVEGTTGVKRFKTLASRALAVGLAYQKVKDVYDKKNDLDDPLVRLVGLFAALSLMKEFVSIPGGFIPGEVAGSYLGLVEAVAAKFVAQLLGRIAEIDLAIAGIQVPPGCLARGITG